MKKFIALCFCVVVLASLTNAQRRTKDLAALTTIKNYVREVDEYMKRNPKAGRIFANVASGVENQPDEWRKFESEQERQNADTGENLNQNAMVWFKTGKIVAAAFTFQSPSRDWANFVTYYFRPDGSLAKSNARLNTFYGNMRVITEKFYNEKGRLLKSSSQYLDLKTQKRRKPTADFIDEPSPNYKNSKTLPFYRLLKLM